MDRGTNPLIILNLITDLDLNLVEEVRAIVSIETRIKAHIMYLCE